MSEDFITLVAAMREAQREYFEVHTRSLLAECKRLEMKVDQWIMRHVAEKVQLDLWSRSIRTDEDRGVYNAEDGAEAEEDSGA